MATRTVSVDLRAKVDNYVSGMKKASAASKAARDAAEKNRKESLLMGKAAAVVGTVVVAQFAKKIIGAASDLNETVSKSTVVFGKNAAAVQAWAKTSAKAFGMSENAALGAASTYGNLFVSLGLAEDQSAKMSTKLVELAGDLASFNNVSPEEALDALRSGLVGETEPLKRFGVNMNEATLKAQAMKMGLVDTTKTALDPAVKAQAAYALILEQTTTAQGDFARTSDGLANQQRILNAEWENAEASLGQTLLPAMTKAVTVLNDMLSAFNALPQPVKNTALAVVAVSAALLVALPRIAMTKAALVELGFAGGKGRKGLLGVGKAAAALLAVQAVGAAIDAFSETMVNNGRTANELENDLKALAAGQKDLALGFQTSLGNAMNFNEALSTVAANSWVDVFGSWIAPIDTTFDHAKQSVEQVDQALADMVSGGNADAAAQAFDKLRVNFIASGGAVEDFDRAFVNYRDALAGTAGDTNEVASATADLGVAAGDAKAEIVDLETALKRLRGQSQSVAEANSSLEQSFDDAAKAAKDMKGGINESRTALDLNTQAGRDGQDALLGIVDAAYDTASAFHDAGMSADKVRARTMDARIEFITTAKKMGLTERAAKKLADKYGLIPSKIATTMTVNNAQALQAVDAVLAKWQAIINMPTAVLNAHFGVTGTGTKKKAAGGFVSGSGTGTSDSIPARLSNGEYVVKASSVKKYGTSMLGDINAGRYANGGPVGFAGGGKVKAPPWDSSTRDQIRGTATVLSFDFGAAAQAAQAYTQAVLRARAAQRGFADATANLADARRKVNEAGTPEEQAAAMRNLADAEREVADAKREEAAADKERASAAKAQADAKPTGRNVLKSFKDRANKLNNFRKNLAILAKRGLSRVIIQQLLDAGIDEGGEMAAAIVRDGNIAELNATQASINKSSAQMAWAYGPKATAGDSSSASSGSTGTTGSAAGSVVLSFENASRPIVLKVEGEQVWKALLKVKRARGGASLGLS